MSRHGRICVLRHACYPFDSRLSKEVQALVEAGYDVDVICLRGERQPCRETVDGATIIRVAPKHRRATMVRYAVQYAFSFMAIFLAASVRALRFRYACVQVNTMPDILVFAALVPRLRGARILLDMHEPMPELFMAKSQDKGSRPLLRLLAFIEQRAIRFADHVLTVNHTIRECFVRRGADPSKISVFRNVPGERFGEPAPRPRGRGGDFLLMTHGMIDSRYGHEIVIRALPLLRDRIPGIRFRILGRGGIEPALLALASRLGCADRVEFRDRVPFAGLADVLAGADLGLVPLAPSAFSRLCQPNKLFEYVAARVPVVAARLPAIEETFDASCVAFFEPGDPHDLAHRVVELYDSPERCRVMVEEAFRRYETVRWSVAKKEYVDLVRRLIDAAD